MLGKLHERGFSNLTGLDYSSKSIDLSRKIHSKTNIKFQQVDILQEQSSDCELFDVFLDKGTYDAIALMPDTDIEDSRKKYRTFLDRRLSSNGRFVLMSCNFTLPELEKFLLPETDNIYGDSLKLEKIHVFEMPKIQFGGAVGQQVVGVVFKRI